MIEEIVLSYLSKALLVPVKTEITDNSITEFVVIEKTGSGTKNHTNSAVIAIQSYGATMLSSAKLNEKVKAAMQSIAELGTISQCKLNTDYNFTDTTSKKYRYQAIFDITYY